MKKSLLPFGLLLAMAVGVITPSCDDDDAKTTWEQYASWRESNTAWFNEQAMLKDEAGLPLYTLTAAAYNPQNQFLMRFIGNPEENEGNYQPLYTSTATVNYEVHLFEGTTIDSAANFTTQLSSSGLITGWSEVITRMHVGDSVEAILPYTLAYGSTGAMAVPPYSVLRFNIRLVDVPAYEVRP